MTNPVFSWLYFTFPGFCLGLLDVFCFVLVAYKLCDLIISDYTWVCLQVLSSPYLSTSVMMLSSPMCLNAIAMLTSPPWIYVSSLGALLWVPDSSNCQSDILPCWYENLWVQFFTIELLFFPLQNIFLILTNSSSSCSYQQREYSSVSCF